MRNKSGDDQHQAQGRQASADSKPERRPGSSPAPDRSARVKHGLY